LDLGSRDSPMRRIHSASLYIRRHLYCSFLTRGIFHATFIFQLIFQLGPCSVY
jgi:hypothetical protein